MKALVDAAAVNNWGNDVKPTDGALHRYTPNKEEDPRFLIRADSPPAATVVGVQRQGQVSSCRMFQARALTYSNHLTSSPPLPVSYHLTAAVPPHGLLAKNGRLAPLAPLGEPIARLATRSPPARASSTHARDVTAHRVTPHASGSAAIPVQRVAQRGTRAHDVDAAISRAATHDAELRTTLPTADAIKNDLLVYASRSARSMPDAAHAIHSRRCPRPHRPRRIQDDRRAYASRPARISSPRSPRAFHRRDANTHPSAAIHSSTSADTAKLRGNTMYGCNAAALTAREKASSVLENVEVLGP
ncbi:hypothetical protein FA95DRAFT_1613574 [Auriscalpium vulgare]|uniref:Uncharacterized protein n=1 Tax=Auriscalpium vulgare TaxID=40419 RepID=A0ACB8R255_9AGAM|nr:hypothetical protein FA95DRAFT_1613574 [Auriscalpium vulgare]